MVELKKRRKLTAVVVDMAEDLVDIPGPALPDCENILDLIPPEHGMDILVQMRAEEILTVKVFGDLVDHIDPETINAEADPIIDHILHFFHDSRVRPIQIRLLYRIGMQIILFALVIVLPSRATESCSPIVLRLIKPVIIVTVLFLPFAGADEPFVLIGGVVRHQIHDQLHITLMHFGDQAVHIFHRAVLRRNAPIVGNVVSVVMTRAFVARTEPECIDTEILQIVQLFDDARDVSDAVPIRIFEAFRIDLVDDHIQKVFVFFRHAQHSQPPFAQTIKCVHPITAASHEAAVMTII